MQQEFGPRRSRETTKPRAAGFITRFYQCPACGSIYQEVMPGAADLICCNSKMELMEEKSPDEVSEDILIDYRITGGYNENVVEVFWKVKNEGAVVLWVYLKTFTGGQMKYVSGKIKNSFVFALADEDAYVYCDEDPCLECTFRCKRGFEIFVCIKEKGLVKIPLDRMHANWHS